MYFHLCSCIYLAINRGLLESRHKTKGLLRFLRGSVLGDKAGKVGAGHSKNGTDVVAKTVNAKIVDLKVDSLRGAISLKVAVWAGLKNA